MYYEKKIIASGACRVKQTLFFMHQLAPLKNTSLHTFEDDQIFMQCFSHNDKTVEIYIILF